MMKQVEVVAVKRHRFVKDLGSLQQSNSSVKGLERFDSATLV